MDEQTPDVLSEGINQEAYAEAYISPLYGLDEKELRKLTSAPLPEELVGQLCIASNRGEVAAFDILFQEYYGALCGTVGRILRFHDRPLAPDMVHITYIKARRTLENFRVDEENVSPGSVWSWLRTIARTAVLD